MGKLRNGFVSGILGIVLFGITYGFDFYGFREYYLNILVPLPVFVLPPIGLFFLLSRGRKVAPSVIGATELPRTMGTETALEEYERLKRESSLRQNLDKEEKLDKSKIEALSSSSTPSVETQPTTKLSIEANGHADGEVPIPFTMTIGGKQYEFEYGISTTELISKGKRKQ